MFETILENRTIFITALICITVISIVITVINIFLGYYIHKNNKKITELYQQTIDINNNKIIEIHQQTADITQLSNRSDARQTDANPTAPDAPTET